jgi:hypothetical protein
MGQYYCYVNATRQQESQVALPFNFRMPYDKSLERLSLEEVKKHFDFVIEQNGWSKGQQPRSKDTGLQAQA